MRKRNININYVESILDFPDNIIVGEPEIIVYQKIVSDNNKPYLYRVFVNIIKRPPVIVTVYKTSKLEKYENQV
jgi:hypothetical protein